MREIRQSGSVRGVRRNSYPYRDCASGVICRSTHPEGARVVRSQGRKRAFCGGSEEKSHSFLWCDFCLETQTRRAFAVANEAERRVPQGADRLLSRWLEEHAGQKEIDLRAGFRAKPGDPSTCLAAEIRANGQRQLRGLA
jgi:hypothetical protein